MNYESKYIQLNPVPEEWQRAGWNETDLAFVVEKLETAPKEKLLKVCKLLGLEFSSDDWEETTPEEQIILAIISDYKPEAVIQTIKKVF